MQCGTSSKSTQTIFQHLQGSGEYALASSREAGAPAMAYEENHFGNTMTGALVGALIGGGLGLGACIYIFEGTLLFAGDTVLVGAVVCGTLGFFLGKGFIEWLKENWWWFW
jgi:hypothetical protein